MTGGLTWLTSEPGYGQAVQTLNKLFSSDGSNMTTNQQWLMDGAPERRSRSDRRAVSPQRTVLAAHADELHGMYLRLVALHDYPEAATARAAYEAIRASLAP